MISLDQIPSNEVIRSEFVSIFLSSLSVYWQIGFVKSYVNLLLSSVYVYLGIAIYGGIRILLLKYICLVITNI